MATVSQPIRTHTDPPSSQELAVPVVEEHLAIDRRVVETGAVRVRKETEQTTARVHEPVTAETVEIERVPIGRTVDGPAQVRQEGDVTVVPVVEERLVTRKEWVLVEEVRIRRRRQDRQAEAEVPLRRERVVIERFDTETGQWRREGDDA